MADVLGVFEQAVLVAVARLGGQGYGRTILTDVQERLGRDVAASAAYATLDRLEAKGLVVSREGETTPARGGRAKRHFTVTPAGLRALAAAKNVTDNIWRGFALPQKGRT
ncbi:MAG TPA: helix-turn-helix transcriptional regulator [Vicinamibacterales bacterium]|jgi:DNA-binding PadR family transcriptional regulator|nr:helix-turn-helix transcriptional regulator [Vicinamibacterales bacterium]